MTHIKIIDSKISILVVLILIFSNQTFSQSFKKQLRKADESFYDEDYENAYQGYNKLSEEFPSEKSVFRYQELLAYHLSTGKGTDINELKSFQKKKGATDEFYNYFMGRIYILRYDFDKAIRHLEAFLKMDVYISKQLFQETEELLKWAQEAKVFYENVDEYELYPLPESVNTEYSEVAPTFFKGHNELIFFRSTDKFSDSFHAYHAIKTEDKWSDISKINVFGEFNNYETRAEILANDNRLLFFKQENGGDLFASRYEENAGWTAPIEYDESLRTRISSDFFMNNDETLILYSSFEGDNQFNIYKIFKTGNTWSEPELLNFNTEQYDEDFPYLSDDEKTLYFSSNRPESIGGYDVFKVLWDESQGNWSEPINLGFPINTIDNEFQFQISHGTNTGYFSSNRLHGKGLYDIYYFFEIEKQKITGRVTNILDNLPLSDITIKFHPIEYTDESIVGSTDSNGEFSINLISNETFKVEFFKSDVLFATKETTIKKTQTNQNFKIEIPDNILSNANLETLYTGSSEKVIPIEMLGNKFRTGKKTVIQNIYFDFQSDNLTAESEPVLETLRRTLSKYPKTNIQIAGFTDNVGSHSYNIGLSLNRANSVKAYLVQKGITASRLQTKGFGELNPLASNDDEKDGRELNRRIEITLIE
jgi:outer membrane protein OmpA-like peptidoglycan-associated protein